MYDFPLIIFARVYCVPLPALNDGFVQHPASHSDHAPSLPPAMGFEVSTSFDGAAYAPERPRDALENGHGHDHHGVGHDSGGEMEVDTGSAPLSDGLFEGALVSGSSGVAASAGLEGVGGTEAGPRVGENHQAVIPTLSSLAGDGERFERWGRAQ